MPKSLPYLNRVDPPFLAEATKWLRSTFKPLINRRLPTVLYGGFKHGFVPGFVQQHKKGIPLNSGFGKALAPLVYIPFFCP